MWIFFSQFLTSWFLSRMQLCFFQIQGPQSVELNLSCNAERFTEHCLNTCLSSPPGSEFFVALLFSSFKFCFKNIYVYCLQIIRKFCSYQLVWKFKRHIQKYIFQFIKTSLMRQMKIWIASNELRIAYTSLGLIF